MARHRTEQSTALSDGQKERVRVAIATLAHNNQFTVRDLDEYVNFSTRAFVKNWLEAGLLKIVDIAPVRYFPTTAGWRLIESR